MPIVPFVDPNRSTEEEPFELVGRPFKSMYRGECAIDDSHKIKRGDIVSKIQRTDNPMIPVTGVACKWCTKFLPKAFN